MDIKQAMQPRGNCYEDSARYLLYGKWKFPWAPPPIELSKMVNADKIFLVHGVATLSRPPHKRYGHAWIEYSLTSTVEIPLLSGDAIEDLDGVKLEFTKQEVSMDYCLDLNTGKNFFKAMYYHAGKIHVDECMYYNRDQALQYLIAYNHFGPWEGPFGCPPHRSITSV